MSTGGSEGAIPQEESTEGLIRLHSKESQKCIVCFMHQQTFLYPMPVDKDSILYYLFRCTSVFIFFSFTYFHNRAANIAEHLAFGILRNVHTHLQNLDPVRSQARTGLTWKGRLLRLTGRGMSLRTSTLSRIRRAAAGTSETSIKEKGKILLFSLELSPVIIISTSCIVKLMKEE